jgi:hypothetical protein
MPWLQRLSEDLLTPNMLATSIDDVKFGPPDDHLVQYGHLRIMVQWAENKYVACFDIQDLFDYLNETITDLDPSLNFPSQTSGATLVAGLLEEMVLTGELPLGQVAHPRL